MKKGGSTANTITLTVDWEGEEYCSADSYVLILLGTGGQAHGRFMSMASEDRIAVTNAIECYCLVGVAFINYAKERGRTDHDEGQFAADIGSSWWSSPATASPAQSLYVIPTALSRSTRSM